MKTIRPLTRLLKPEPGESFPSYIERLAALHQVDLLVILHYLGLIQEEKYERLNAYGVFLNEAHLANFCKATRLSRKQAEQMLLSAYNGKGLNLAGVDPTDKSAFFKKTISEWAYFSGSHVCPACIKENHGAWQLSWKMPWTFACVKHRCYLASDCPSCRRRLGSGRIDRSLSPVFVKQAPRPGYCGNSRALGEANYGRMAQPCGQALCEIPVTRAGMAALRRQNILNDALNGSPPQVVGVSVNPSEYFEDLRTLCALILYCAEAEDLGRISNEELSSFNDFATHRNQTILERWESATPRNAERVRVFIGPPETPDLMAAVLALAIPILAAKNIGDMVHMLRPLAERCIDRSSKFRWQVMQYFRFSDRIKPAFHESLAYRSTFNRSIGIRSVAAANAQYVFTAGHVPQLLWEYEFDQHFSHFFSSMVSPCFARRFCAMSLVRLCGDYTWGQTAELLGLPIQSSIKMANKCIGLLSDEKIKKRFGRALHELAQRLSDNPEKVDFSLRRKALSNFTTITRKDWTVLCNEGGITPGLRGRRSKYAAVWLWAELSGGDWRLAPALDGEDIPNSREVYRSLNKKVLPKIYPHLRMYGETLLAKRIGK